MTRKPNVCDLPRQAAGQALVDPWRRVFQGPLLIDIGQVRNDRTNLLRSAMERREKRTCDDLRAAGWTLSGNPAADGAADGTQTRDTGADRIALHDAVPSLLFPGQAQNATGDAIWQHGRFDRPTVQFGECEIAFDFIRRSVPLFEIGMAAALPASTTP